MARVISVALVLLAGACGAGTQHFRPTDRVDGASREGFPAASYDVPGASGRLAEVVVWSQGAARERVAGAERTLLHVGVEVRNLGREPVALDPQSVRLEALHVRDGVVPSISPAEIRALDGGGLEIASESTREFDVWFGVPPGVGPRDLGAFRLRWALTAAGHRHLRFTAFAEDERRERESTYLYGVYPYHDPFFFYSAPAPRVVVIDRVAIPRHRHVTPRRR